jgi:hypothetical protein
MSWITRLLRLSNHKRSLAHHRKGRPPARLWLEGLETRLAPANVFVVPLNVATDGSHFHTLTAALSAATASGTVTIEPGTTPDPGQVTVTQAQNGVTIQGDPNVPGSILAVYNINVDANGVILNNLNLGIVSMGGGFSATSVTHCLVQNITELQSISLNGGSTIAQNFITGTLALGGNTSAPVNDFIANNTFSSLSPVILSATTSAGDVITSNQFFGDVLNQTAIQLRDSGTSGVPTTVANNTIVLAGAGSFGITVAQVTGVTGVNVLNNSLNTNNMGQGLTIAMNTAGNVRILVQGNDFHNNQIGIALSGDGVSSAFAVDMGGGGLNSLGGNNFRSFTSTGTTSAAAILLLNTPSGAQPPALNNMFNSLVLPTTVIDDGVHGSATGTGSLNVSAELDQNTSFVQALYNEVLGRTGTLGELNGWVNVLNMNNQNRAPVVNGILRSNESLGRIVDGFYLRFLGRASDPAGRAGWINFLKGGGTLEQMTTAFVTSPEYISHINVDYVQSLYINILGRTGASSELAGWNNQIQTIGLTGIANGFSMSTEYRFNTVFSNFVTFLHRTPPASEVNSFITNMHGDLLTLEADVLVSAEFFTNG